MQKTPLVLQYKPLVNKILLIRLSLRENDLEHEEEYHHGHASRDKRHKDVIDRRHYIIA